MAKHELFFSNDQLGNFNTSKVTLKSQDLKVNDSHPGDRLVSGGKVDSVSDITGWRLTVCGDEEPGDNDVIPFARILVDYSTDGGETWNSYAKDIGHPKYRFYARQDEEGWMGIVANDFSQHDKQIGFIVADDGVTAGQIFTTDEPFFRKQKGEYAIPCFTAGTMIATGNGERAVEDLRPGDMVQTLDHGLQPVTWAGQRTISVEQMIENPKLQPIRISAGSLGQALPVRDLLVSRQHRMLMRRDEAQSVLNSDEFLVAAHHLTMLAGIEQILPEQSVTYVHILFDKHEVLLAENAPSESLFTGVEALKAIGPEAVEEIAALFPELLDRPAVPARPFPQTGRDARRLLTAA